MNEIKTRLSKIWQCIKKWLKELVTETDFNWAIYKLSTEDGSYTYQYLPPDDVNKILFDKTFIVYGKGNLKTKKEIVDLKRMTTTGSTFAMRIEFFINKFTFRKSLDKLRTFIRWSLLIGILGTCCEIQNVKFSNLSIHIFLATLFKQGNLISVFWVFILSWQLFVWCHRFLDGWGRFTIPSYKERLSLIEVGSIFIKKGDCFFIESMTKVIHVVSEGVAVIKREEEKNEV